MTPAPLPTVTPTASSMPFQLPINTISPATANRFSDIRQVIEAIGNTIISNLLLVAGTLAVFFLIYAGIRYILAGGNAERAKEARAGVIHVVIGVVIIVSAFFIIRVAVSLGNTITSIH